MLISLGGKRGKSYQAISKVRTLSHRQIRNFLKTNSQRGGSYTPARPGSTRLHHSTLPQDVESPEREGKTKQNREREVHVYMKFPGHANMPQF